ncbi:hypothetical protein CRE_14934 [Caenorhabditis remanei]|uniref:DUF38 domain-containing protein n=1 Tax=Caenorhabditis remanei TaxID=31234 RepID=E3NBV8_CAERE|nr:hypothetical protein CRE_14934 [Caenorhabditis remanei]
MQIEDWHRSDHYDIDGCCTCTRPLRNFIEAHEHLEKINKTYTLQQTADKFYGRFADILRSRKSSIFIQNLEMNVLRSSYVLNVAQHIDVKQLRRIVIRKTPEYYDRENGKQLVMNEIVELDVFKYIQELCIKDFKITVPLETFLHIQGLTISISTITIGDVLLIKKVSECTCATILSFL